MMSAWVISCAVATMAASPSHYHHDHHHPNRKPDAREAASNAKLEAVNLKLKAAMKSSEGKEEAFQEHVSAEEKEVAAFDIKEYKKSNAFELKHEKHMADSEQAFEHALEKSETDTRRKGTHQVHEFEAALEKISKSGEEAMGKLHEKEEKLQDFDADSWKTDPREADSPDPTSFLQTVEKVVANVATHLDGMKEVEKVEAQQDLKVEAQQNAAQMELTKSAVKSYHTNLYDDSLRMEKQENVQIKHLKDVEQHMKTEQTHVKAMAAAEVEKEAAVFEKFHSSEATLKATYKHRHDEFEQSIKAKHEKNEIENESLRTRLNAIHESDVEAGKELYADVD